MTDEMRALTTRYQDEFRYYEAFTRWLSRGCAEPVAAVLAHEDAKRGRR